VYLLSWGTRRSSARARGSARGARSAIAATTTGARRAAIRNFPGPVKKALGMISPKKRTAVTLRRIAAQLGAIASRKRGSASFANEFTRSSVTRTWWCGSRSTIGSSVRA